MYKDKKPKGPWTKIILEEIALEGLEGITIEGVWIRFEQALNLSCKTPDVFKILIWDFIKKQDISILEFFELPAPKEKIKIANRSEFIDRDMGFPVLPDECPFYRPNYKSISEGSIRGSCEYFYERKKIPSSELENMSLNQFKEKYGEKCVIVASQVYRNNILFPEITHKITDLTSIQYCVLEAIGRSRYTGETTAGKQAINTFIKDYLDIFYIKTKLMSLQLIVKQPYMERLHGRISSGFILHLPKFYKVYKTRPVVIIETLYNILTMAPNKTLEVETLKKNPPFEGLSFKKLSKVPFFSKYFELTRVLYRVIYPDAEIEKWKNTKLGREKYLFVVRFKNPNVTLEEIFQSTNIENTETENIEFLSDKFYYLDMPFQEQVYRLIASYGEVGCSQMQIVRHTAISKYSVRQLIKSFLKMGYIKEYATDVGRQRVVMFVTHNNTADQKVLSQEMIAESTIAEETVIKRMNEIENEVDIKVENIDGLKLDKINQVCAIIKETQPPYTFIDNKTVTDPKTARHNKRMKIIIDYLNNKFLVEKNVLRKYIIAEEEKLGYKDQICSKSLFRIIKWLITKNLAKFYEVTLKINKYVKIILYLAHSKLDPQFKIMQNEIFKQKFAFLMTLEERERPQVNSKQQPSLNDENAINYRYIRETFARSPKFLTARFIHEFIYFLVYEQDRNITPINEYDKIFDSAKELASDYDINRLKNDISVGCFENNLSWKMFIKPLPKYEDKPFGWVYIMDIYLRLPLSIIIKMYQISKYCHPLFSEYVNDPVKQHYLVHQLPKELQELLSHFRVGRNLITVLVNLNWFGLIQIGKRCLRELRECWMYVNRKGKLLDTTSSTPKYRYISTDIVYSESIFTFNTAVDVQNYWNTLYKICLSTKLGAKHDITRVLTRRHELEFLKTVDFDDAVKNDKGFIPGDGLGASGLDSGLFSHLPRNWTWRAIKKNPTAKKLLPTKVNKIRFSSRKAKKAIEKPINIKPNNQNTVKLISSKRIAMRAARKITQKKRKCEYDEIDRQALKRMSSLRVVWSDEEDRMLKICRAVYIYLSSSISQLQRAINSYLYRDILQWSLNSLNKTSRACQRRLRYMLRFRPSPDVFTWAQELKQNSKIKTRFNAKNLTKLRKKFKKDSDFINTLKIIFVTLVHHLNTMLRTTEVVPKRRKLLPDTLDKFYRKFKVAKMLNPRQDICQVREFALKHIDPKTIEDVEISTINSIMHSTLCCARDKTLYNIQIFEVYKKFKEEILAKAYKKARDDNLVVQLKFKSGASGSKLAPISGSSLVLSVKYKQQLYLDIPYEAIDLCFRQFESTLLKFFGGDPTPLAFKTVDSGSFYHLLESIATDQVDVEVQLPQKILTIDPNHSISGNESERIMDHFHLIFDNAPKTEYVKYFEHDGQNNGPRVKFNKTNENFRLIYNPYDILSKLPDDYYHFFCVLDNLNKIIDLDFSRFNMDTFCPFNCILKYKDEINRIENIVNENKNVIEDLLHNPDDIEEIIESVVLINQKNLIQVFERLQKVLRERNIGNDQRDFGKLKIERNKINVLKLSKSILDYTDVDFENKFEFESGINKEDKSKSQDVYVVNLPTLKFLYKNERNNPKEEYVIYKNLTMPKNIVKNSIYREEILKKIIGFSHWSYNGNVKEFLQSQTFKRLNNNEQIFTQNLLNFLEKFELGASADVLVQEFKDEKLLVKITTILRKMFLIMRVGVENYFYVHKNHITPWVVNSYNIKRLDKESLQYSNVIIKNDLKAEKRSSNTIDLDEPPSKKEIIEQDSGKRISKPNKIYQASTSTAKTKEHFVKEKENIILRPYPWIRINGSLNRRVLDKWIGVILTDCLLNTGQTIKSICERFNQLHPTNLRCLLEILVDLNCIKLKAIKKIKNITIFSKIDDLITDEEEATEFSSMDETFIIAEPNAMVNLGIFIGEKKYGMDFI